MVSSFSLRSLLAALIITGLPAMGVGPGPAHGATAPPFPYVVGGVAQIAQLIGPTPESPAARYAPSPHSINDTMHWGICSGDLGSLMYAHGTAYIALGDNYTSCPPGTGGPGANLRPPDWRSNALGVIPDPTNFTHGLHIARWISRDGRHAAEVIPSQHNAGACQDAQTPGCEVTRIPTYGFATQGHLFLAFMSVHHWGVPATWEVNYSSFAMSADKGTTWTVETRKVRWGSHSNFAQVAVAPAPGSRYLLFYGIPAGRFGAVKLMRTRNTWRGVLTAHDYEYYTGIDATGRPRWSGSPARAVTIADAPVGELSVIYDPGLKQWLMTYLQGGNDAVMPSNDNLVIRSAPHYWGPWSQPATLATHQRYPGLYGAFMNPYFLSDNGHTIYFVMSQWTVYSVFWMKASLVASLHVDRDVVEGLPGAVDGVIGQHGDAVGAGRAVDVVDACAVSRARVVSEVPAPRSREHVARQRARHLAVVLGQCHDVAVQGRTCEDERRPRRQHNTPSAAIDHGQVSVQRDRGHAVASARRGQGRQQGDQDGRARCYGTPLHREAWSSCTI
jgi:hypothetical protein